jgi:hypothetical protein
MIVGYARAPGRYGFGRRCSPHPRAPGRYSLVTVTSEAAILTRARVVGRFTDKQYRTESNPHACSGDGGC